MSRDEQEPLTEMPPGLRIRRWCRGWRCGRELTDPESMRRGYGPECDPDTRGRHERRNVDQDPIPGL